MGEMSGLKKREEWSAPDKRFHKSAHLKERKAMAELRRGLTPRKTAIVVATVIIVVVGGFAFLVGAGPPLCQQSSTATNGSAEGGGSQSISEELGDAASYLVKNYDPTVGLIPETPGSCTFWLYSDNFLAATALLQYGHGQGNATLTKVAADILTSESKYYADLHGAENQYTLLVSPPCGVNASQGYTIFASRGLQIKATLNNGSGELSDAQYADVAFLKAVCLYDQGNVTGAMTAYSAGRTMFDGVGFRDLPYNQTGLYQTYKLALYVYASDTLNQQVNETVLATLMRMQAPDGGFYTGYDASYSTSGTSTNTETTSLAILALYGYPEG
jgi:hypothetical protein